MLTLAPARPRGRQLDTAVSAHLLPPPASLNGDRDESPGFRLQSSASPSGGHAGELAHDARNFLSAINLYCELLATPGVLAPRFRHYATDLRHLGRAGGRLLSALAAELPWAEGGAALAESFEAAPPSHPFPPIEDLAEELLALESPLQAIAGGDVRLEVECAPCAGQLGLNSEALLRILFNLIANSVEAMHRQPAANRRRFIRITAQRGRGASFLDQGERRGHPDTVVLSIRDNGPGIPAGDLPRIFDSGFSTRAEEQPGRPQPQLELSPFSGAGRSSGHGLAIVLRLVQAAGGTVRAVSSAGFGARFDIELPLRRSALKNHLGSRPT